jgi:hypothetical protein
MTITAIRDELTALADVARQLSALLADLEDTGRLHGSAALPALALARALLAVHRARKRLERVAEELVNFGPVPVNVNPNATWAG